MIKLELQNYDALDLSTEVGDQPGLSNLLFDPRSRKNGRKNISRIGKGPILCIREKKLNNRLTRGD